MYPRLRILADRPDQRCLWEANSLYLDHMGPDTFYGLPDSLRGHLSRDADSAAFDCADN